MIDPLTCRQVFDRIDDYLDRELSGDESARVLAHLEACVVCAREHRFEAEVLEGLKHKLRRLEAPVGLIDRVRAALAAEEDPPPG